MRGSAASSSGDPGKERESRSRLLNATGTTVEGRSTSRQPDVVTRSKRWRRAPEVTDTRQVSSASSPLRSWSRMNPEIATPSLEEPAHQGFGPLIGPTPSSSTPITPAPAPSSSSSPFVHFKDVVEAQQRGDIASASLAFKALSARLHNLPRDSKERSEIFAECGLHLLLEARRCQDQHQTEEAQTKAQRARECLQTSIKLQRAHFLWLGNTLEFLMKRTEAQQAYRDGLQMVADLRSSTSYDLWTARVLLYTREQDWESCWRTLMNMLQLWPNEARLCARVGYIIIRRDSMDSPLGAYEKALEWYRSASNLDPTNSLYKATIQNLEAQIPSLLAFEAPAPDPQPHLPYTRFSSSSQNTITSASEYGNVLPPWERQYVGMHEAPPSRPVTTAPQMRHFPSLAAVSQRSSSGIPRAPEPWELPTPSLRSRSAISSPGPAQPRRKRGLLNKMHEAVKSIHDVARAVSPLRENVRDTERRLSQQYASLEGQVQELHIRQDNLEQEVYRRLSDAEAGIAGMRAGWNHSRPRTPTPEEFLEPFSTNGDEQQQQQPDRAASPSRARSVPPQQYTVGGMSQAELLDRSIMLYGVWALEKRLQDARIAT